MNGRSLTEKQDKKIPIWVWVIVSILILFLVTLVLWLIVKNTGSKPNYKFKFY